MNEWRNEFSIMECFEEKIKEKKIADRKAGVFDAAVSFYDAIY